MRHEGAFQRQWTSGNPPASCNEEDLKKFGIVVALSESSLIRDPLPQQKRINHNSTVKWTKDSLVFF